MSPPAGPGSADRPAAVPRFCTATVYPGLLMLWAAAQTFALGVAAVGFPAAWPPVDRLPIHAWVVAQWLILAAFFPDLLATAGTAAAVVAMIWPYSILAGLLARTRAGVLAVSLDQTLWVIALAGCTAVLSSEAARVAAARLVRWWLVAGVLVAYSLADRSPPAAVPKWLSHINPLLATGDVLNANTLADVVSMLAPASILAVLAWAGWAAAALFPGKSPSR